MCERVFFQYESASCGSVQSCAMCDRLFWHEPCLYDVMYTTLSIANSIEPTS